MSVVKVFAPAASVVPGSVHNRQFKKYERLGSAGCRGVVVKAKDNKNTSILTSILMSMCMKMTGFVVDVGMSGERRKII